MASNCSNKTMQTTNERINKHHNQALMDKSLDDLYYKIKNNLITNVLEAIKHWVDTQPDKVAYYWIDKVDGKVTVSYTYGEVWKKIEGIAYNLTNEWNVKEGEHVFIVYPPGLEFLFAHFGCMLAGCVSVPVYPPIPGRTLKKGVEKLKLLQESCNARIALTSRTYNLTRKGVKITSFKTKWPKLNWHTTDTIKWKSIYAIKEIKINPNSLAFLQYTSGSTGDPKGVMILHKNYLYNVYSGSKFCVPLGSKTRLLCWLPQYHDLGLIACYTTVICVGGTVYGMSPFTFLSQPSIWIHCLSKYKCDTTGGPNFAFELTVRKWYKPKDGHIVDLSHVIYIGNGAEPVRLATINKFYSVFQEYGLHRGVIKPQCGLAETCVFGAVDHSVYTVMDLSGIRRVCCGNIDRLYKHLDVDYRIINPETGEELKDNEEGEIIISSKSIAAGYMNRPELSKEMFQFQLPNNNNNNNNNNRKYLRTGDLGMIVKPDREWSIANPDRHPIYGQNDALLEDELNQRHLVITGRIKDLIIINGRNYYPQDIELCVEHALTDERLVRSGCVVATSIEWNNEESFGIVCELRNDVLKNYIKERRETDKTINKEIILKEICIEMVKEIHAEFGVKPSIVSLIKEKTIPKTTSGKVRRKATAAALLAGDQLKLVYQYYMKNLQHNNNRVIKVQSVHNTGSNELHLKSNSQCSFEDIKTTVYKVFSDSSAIDTFENSNLNALDEIGNSKNIEDIPFSEMALASMDIVSISIELEEIYGVNLNYCVFTNHSTISKLAQYIYTSNTDIATKTSDSKLNKVTKNSSETRNMFGPLSGSQKQIVMYQKLHPNFSGFNIYGMWKYKGKIDSVRLENSMKLVINRFEALRTNFFEISSTEYTFIQIVKPQVNSKWFFVMNDDDDILAFMVKPFELNSSALFRLVLTKSIIALVLHHSIADGISLQLVLSYLSSVYNGESTTKTVEKQVKYIIGSFIHYVLSVIYICIKPIDFALYEMEKLQTQSLNDSLHYWCSHLNALIEQPFRIKEISNKMKMPRASNYVSKCFKIDTCIYDALNQMSKDNTIPGTTQFTLLLSAFHMFLQLLSNCPVIGVNFIYANRPNQYGNSVGMFANTVVNCIDFCSFPTEYPTFYDLALFTINSMNYKHYWLPLSHIYNHIRRTGNIVPSDGLSDVMFVYQDKTITKRSLNFGTDVAFDLLKFGTGNPQSLTFEIINQDTSIETLIIYDSDTFLNSEIDTIAQRWNTLLHNLFVQSENLHISCHNFLFLQADIELINSSNDTYIEWDNNNNNGTVIDLIIEQAKLYPDKVALHMNDDILTYKEFINACYIFAIKLQDEYNINVGDVVCVCVNRSFEMIIGIISIMMCGGIYCPIHPNESNSRIDIILEETKCKALLIDSIYSADITNNNNNNNNNVVLIKASTICINNVETNSIKDVYKLLDKLRIRIDNSKDTIAYCVFTSGSTGKPKGVNISHDALFNTASEHIKLNNNDICLQWCRCTFDVHIADIFCTLCNGAELVLMDDAYILDFDKILKYINEMKITSIQIVPSYLRRLCEYIIELNNSSQKRVRTNNILNLQLLHQIMLSGEKFDFDLFELLIQCVSNECKIYNLYGPAEATVDCTVYEIIDIYNISYKTSSSIPIGRPLPNYQCYVLNSKTRQLVIPGQIGELYIAGRGLMNGYINQPELTAERLINIQLPTSIHGNGSEVLAYRTGDLVYQMNDGNLVYVGRVDFQVKIRGQRVELGEIENILKQHELIQNIAVVANKDIKTHDIQLVAYITLSNNKYDNKSDENYYMLNNKYTNILYDYCNEQLPIHMHPSIYIVMKELPLNQNMKINRKQLPSLASSTNEAEVYKSLELTADILNDKTKTAKKRTERPFSDLQKKVAAIWARLLNIDINQISRKSNFFKIGGSSLSAAQLVSLLRQDVNENISIKIVFKNPVFKDMCKKLRKGRSTLIFNTKRNKINSNENLKQTADSVPESLNISAKKKKSKKKKKFKVAQTFHYSKKELEVKETIEDNSFDRCRSIIQMCDNMRVPQIQVIKENTVNTRYLSWSKLSVQTLWILFVLLYIGSSMLLPMMMIRKSINHFGTNNIIIIGSVFVLAVICLGLEIILLILCSKLILVRKLKAGTYDMWSKQMLKWWCFYTLLNAFHPLIAFFLVETRWLVYWYRLLGASIGNHCVIKTTELLDPNMITIGDNCVISTNTQILGHRFIHDEEHESIKLELDHVIIEDHCYIEDRCIIECGTSMKIGSELKAGSVLLYGQIVPPGGLYEGNPAVFVGQASNKLSYYRSMANGFIQSIIQLILCCVLIIIILIPFIFSLWIGNCIWNKTSRLYAIWFLLGVVPYIVSFLVCISVIILRRLVMSVQSITGHQKLTRILFLQRWFIDRLVTLLTLLVPFVGGLTFISQLLYYLMGMSIDIFSSQVSNLDVGCDIDLLVVGKHAWCGYNLNIVGSHYEEDNIITNHIIIEDNCVLGENVMLLPGSMIKSSSTIGSNTTISSSSDIKSGGIYVGNTEIPSNMINENMDKQSMVPLFHLCSLCLHLLGIILLILLSFPIAYIFSEFIYDKAYWTLEKDASFWILLPLLTWKCIFIGISGLSISLIYTCIIANIDRFLLQRFIYNDTTLFSLSGVLWQWSTLLKGYTLLNPKIHNRFLLGGTYFITGIIKLFGANIDWDIFLYNTVINECHTIKIEADCSIEGALLLAHTVENHKLKQGTISIANKCCINSQSRIMPG